MKRTQMQGDNADAWKGQGTAAPNSPELEIKDAQLIFGAIWRDLEGVLGRSRMRFPRELIMEIEEHYTDTHGYTELNLRRIRHTGTEWGNSMRHWKAGTRLRR